MKNNQIIIKMLRAGIGFVFLLTLFSAVITTPAVLANEQPIAEFAVISTSVLQGGTTSVSVELSHLPQNQVVNGIWLIIHYEPSMFTLSNPRSIIAGSSYFRHKPGELEFTWETNDIGAHLNGELFTFDLTAADDAPAGLQILSVYCQEFYKMIVNSQSDFYFVDIPYTLSPGELTIIENGDVDKGDVDNSGTVDLRDLMMMRNHVLNVQLLTGTAFAAADIDDSGKITLYDLVAIRNLLL